MSPAASWLVLIVAGLFEVGWAIGLKYTQGFTRLWPTVWTALALVISMALLGAAVKALPVGTAYAVWVGIGAVGTAVLGIVLLGEAASLGRVASIALIVVANHRWAMQRGLEGLRRELAQGDR
jgi:quaternary ammonium compound-resistance protein SugE